MGLDKGLLEEIVERPILTSITHKDMDIIISGPKPNKQIDNIINIIYGTKASKLTSLEYNALKFFIKDSCIRYHHIERDTQVAYYNHVVDVAAIANIFSEDFTTNVSALYHDSLEEYIAGLIKKEANKRIINEYNQRAIEKFGKEWSKLNRKDKNGIKLTKEVKRTIKDSVEEDYKQSENKLISSYLLQLNKSLKEGLNDLGMDNSMAHKLADDICETVMILTRSYYDTYYEAIDRLISPDPTIKNIENKFRAIEIKFVDNISNTEIVKYEGGYRLKDLTHVDTLQEPQKTNAFKKYETLTKALRKKHKEEKRKLKIVPGKKRLYRTFKNYFLVNAYRIYSQHMYISNVLKDIMERDMFDDLFENIGVLSYIHNLTELYVTNRKVPKSEKIIFINKLEGYEKNRGKCLSTKLQSRQSKKFLIRRCCESGYFNYSNSVDLVKHICDMYINEKDVFDKQKEQIKRYEETLSIKTYNSAKAILDHLVAYHSAGPHLSQEKILLFLKQNIKYIEDGGYKFVTNPVTSEEYIKKMGENGITKLNGETKKTLKSPDGILKLFIDARIRGENKKLDDLYSNKANMFLAALASKTLGYSYIHYPNYILVGLDSHGIHPTGAIALKTYETLKKEENEEQKLSDETK